MAGGIPDVGVRLTTSGVDDVLAAFRRVAAEAKQTGKDSSDGLGLINTAVASLSGLLPTITFAAVITGAAKIASGALDTADALDKLSEKTGAAVGTLSVLNLVAHDSGTDQEAFSNGLIKLSKNMEDASEGAKKPTQAFKALGVTVADLKNQDPGQLFVTLAQKLDALPDGAQKAQIAMTLFGKAGANLLPMLQSLGVDGFDQALAKAQKLGIYLDGPTTAAAHAAQDAFHELGDIATGLGTRFVAGFAPQFTSGIEILAEGLTGQGVSSVQTFGDATGKIFKALTLDLLIIIDTVKFAFSTIVDGVKGAYGTAQSFQEGFVQNGIIGAVSNVSAYNQGPGADFAKQQAQRNADYVNQIKTIRSEANKPIDRTLSTPKKGAGAAGNDTANQDKIAAAKSAYDQALADNELALLKTTNSLEEAEDKRHYDAGLITVDDYYSKVEDRIKAESDAEIAILRTKMTAAEALPQDSDTQIYKRLQEINDIQTKIDQVQSKSQADIAAAEDAIAKAKHDNALKELDDQEKLQKADGDVYGAERTQLQIELQQYDELLKKRKDLTAEQRAALVDAASEKGHAKIDYGINSTQLGFDMAGMNQDIQAVQDQASSGQISQIAAETKILGIETDRLATMKTLAQVMLEQATTAAGPQPDAAGTALLNQAKANLANINHQISSLSNVTSAQTYLINQLSTQGVSALTDFFTAGIDGSKSFADALADLGAQFEQIVAGMISKLLVYETLAAVIGWIDPSFTAADSSGNSGFTAAFGKSPFGSGHAAGGWTGDVPTNQIAGYVHGQEYVVKAGPAAKNRALLDALNSGAMDTPSLTPISAMQQGHADYAKGVADSGGVTGASLVDVPPPIINVITGGQPAKQTQKTSPGGQSVTDIVIGIVSKDLASGGQTAQTLQANYGLSRNGVRRG